MGLIGHDATVTFNGNPIANLRNIDVNMDGNPIDVTTMGDLTNKYLPATTDVEITIEALGDATVGVGDTGTLVITPGTGDPPLTLNNMFISSVRSRYRKNEATTTEMVFKPKKV